MTSELKKVCSEPYVIYSVTEVSLISSMKYWSNRKIQVLGRIQPFLESNRSISPRQISNDSSTASECGSDCDSDLADDVDMFEDKAYSNKKTFVNVDRQSIWSANFASPNSSNRKEVIASIKNEHAEKVSPQSSNPSADGGPEAIKMELGQNPIDFDDSSLWNDSAFYVNADELNDVSMKEIPCDKMLMQQVHPIVNASGTRLSTKTSFDKTSDATLAVTSEPTLAMASSSTLSKMTKGSANTELCESKKLYTLYSEQEEGGPFHIDVSTCITSQISYRSLGILLLF